MPENSKTVSIVSVNYNQVDVTCQMLDSIRLLSHQPHQIILVDNGSSISPKERITSAYPEVTFIESHENLGFSGGNNLGIAAATGDYIFLANNDTEWIEGCLESLVELFEKIPKLGIVSPLICYHPEQHKHEEDLIQYAGTTEVNKFTARNVTIGHKELDQGQFKKACPTAYAHGAAMMIPREVIEKVGKMPAQFFLYYEELDWCEKIRNAGYKIYIEPNARIYHKESVSVGQMSTLKTYYINRNRIFFMRRNKKGPNLFIFALFLLFFTIPKNSLVYLMKGQLDHLKVFYKAIWWNVLQKDKTENFPTTQTTKISAG